MSNLRRRVMGGGDDTYGYIILDQSQTDPTLKIVDMSGRTYATGYRTPRVIETIRKMSHCYVGTSGGDVLYLKQLDDNDHTMYADGTSAATDITQKNVFMRLPYFYTRATEITSASNLTPSSGSTIWMIEFFIDKKQTFASTLQPAGNGWMQWGGNDLIGKYKGNCSNTSNNTSGTLRSISGVVPTKSVSQSNFKTKAAHNGSGYTLVRWRHQNIIAILFYACYGYPQSFNVIGYNESVSTNQSGLKNSFGMNDTDSVTGSVDNSIFWGLENWLSPGEFMHDIVNYKGISISVQEESGTRTLDDKFTNTTNNTPYKLLIGDNLDTIGIDPMLPYDENTGYCCYQTIATWQQSVARREVFSGFIAIESASETHNNVSSRLAYKGAIEIV